MADGLRKGCLLYTSQSGNGREWGKYGLEEYLEVKAVAGYNAA